MKHLYIFKYFLSEVTRFIVIMGIWSYTTYISGKIVFYVNIFIES